MTRGGVLSTTPATSIPCTRDARRTAPATRTAGRPDAVGPARTGPDDSPADPGRVARRQPGLLGPVDEVLAREPHAPRAPGGQSTPVWQRRHAPDGPGRSCRQEEQLVGHRAHRATAHTTFRSLSRACSGRQLRSWFRVRASFHTIKIVRCICVRSRKGREVVVNVAGGAPRAAAVLRLRNEPESGTTRWVETEAWRSTCSSTRG